MNNTLGDLQTFARAAELGSLTRAAHALGLTPSAVSRSLQRLEERLHTRLLYRTTRNVSLTEEGARFHQRLLQLFSDLEEAEAEAKGQPGYVSGTLRISTFTAFGPHQLLNLLPEFTRRHPALKIDLDFSDRRIDLVAEGIDVAIRLGALSDSSLMARKIAWTTRVICASPAYIARKGMPKVPSDLAQHDCLAFRDPGLVHLNDWPFDTPNGRIAVPVAGPIIAGDGDTVFRLAEAGLGIGRLSRFVAEAGLRDGKLVPLLTAFEVQDQTPLHVVYPHRKHLPPKVAAFIDFLVESFGAVPPWERRV